MRVTPDRLAVAEAVVQWISDWGDEVLTRSVTADLRAVIEAIPEPEPLPAPTGPGWWWADGQPVSVDDDGLCWVTGSEVERPTRAYLRWFPLVPPEVKP